MKIVFRNFINTLRHFRLASSLNILGLSIAFAAFFIIMVQVNYEKTFDTSYKKTGRIYRVETSTDSVTYKGLLARPISEALAAAIPQIENFSLHVPWIQDLYIKYKGVNDDLLGTKETLTVASESLPEVYDFDIIDGNPDPLGNPGGMMIPQSMAVRMFGDQSAVGRQLYIGADTMSLVIGAVYKDFPDNSSMINNIKMNMGDYLRDNWFNTILQFTVVLRSDADPVQVARSMEITYKGLSLPDYVEDRELHFRLAPIEDIYYQTDTEFELLPKGNRNTTNILFAIAVLVIAIASINFINFSTAMVPLRLKSINTQKVLGSSTCLIRLSMIFEALGTCFLAFCIAVLWTYLFEKAGFSSILLSDVSISANLPVLFIVLAVAVVIGVISGIYPAYYITSFQPALVLKGSFGLSLNGRRLRTVLLGFQFVISAGLIIAALFLYLQNRYLLNYDSGIDRSNIAMVDLNAQMFSKHKSLIVDKLKGNSGIKDVGFANSKVGISDLFNMHGGDKSPSGEPINYCAIFVSDNFVDMMGLEIVSGRDFQKSDLREEGMTMIFNQSAVIDHDLGENINIGNGKKVVGVVKDFNFMSLRKGIEPMALFVADGNNRMLPHMFVKITGNPFQAAEFIRETLSEIDPIYPVSIDFYDQQFQQTYIKEQKITKQITMLSILAVMISLVGIFGLVVFETHYRRREIGVRKVYGSTVTEILAMFNKGFVIILAVCFVIAAPLAYIGVTKWLEVFAYRTPVYWWVFGIALVIVAALTFVTVTVQSWRAATANPVDSLKSE